MLLRQLSASALVVLRVLFSLRLEVADEPEGVYLGSLNLPGASVTYLNVEIKFLLARLLLGHIRFY